MKYYWIVSRNRKLETCDRYALAIAANESITSFGGPHDIATELTESEFNSCGMKLFSEILRPINIVWSSS